MQQMQRGGGVLIYPTFLLFGALFLFSNHFYSTFCILHLFLFWVVRIRSGYYTESYITLFLPALSAKLHRLGIGNP